VLYKKPEQHISRPFKLACYLNIALCYIKLEQYYDAIANCDLALEIDPKNVKAIYRKGLAYMKAQRFEDAKQEFQKVLTIETTNEDAKRKLNELKELMQKHSQKEKKKFGGWLNKVEMYPDKTLPQKPNTVNQLSYVQFFKNNIWILIITVLLMVLLLFIVIYNKAH
jgi:tetratricopeptide (TPR) repeat protein